MMMIIIITVIIDRMRRMRMGRHLDTDGSLPLLLLRVPSNIRKYACMSDIDVAIQSPIHL